LPSRLRPTPVQRELTVGVAQLRRADQGGGGDAHRMQRPLDLAAPEVQEAGQLREARGAVQGRGSALRACQAGEIPGQGRHLRTKSAASAPSGRAEAWTGAAGLPKLPGSRASSRPWSRPTSCAPVAPPSLNWASRHGTGRACARTTGPGFRTSRCGGESGRCGGSSRPAPPGASSPCTPPPTRRSTSSAT